MALTGTLLACDMEHREPTEGQAEPRTPNVRTAGDMASNDSRRQRRVQSFETSVRKAMGKKWNRLSPEDRKVVRELSECEKGSGRIPPEER